MIRPETTGAVAAREIARIARQIESSDRREAITDARRETRLRAEHAAPYAARGFEVLTAQPTFDTASGYVPAEDMLTLDGSEVTRDVIDATPTAWAVWLSYDRAGMLVDAATGDEVAEDTVDWSTSDDPDATPAPGLCHADSVEERDCWIADFYGRDLAAAGVRLASPASTDAVGEESHDDGHVDPPADDEAAAAQRREQERAERRRVLAYNKWGLAAQAVRREWLTGLLARKSAPADAAGFVAAALARDPHLLTQNKARETTATLLGLETATGLTAVITAASPARAQVLTLALVLGAYEARTTKDAWRGGYYARDVASYLRFLAENGHALAPIEELTAGLRSGEQMPPLD